MKRFIAHGSLLPSWETKFSNTRDALNDDELASCVDFVLGQIERALTEGTRVWLLAQGEATGPRAEVDAHFFQALRDSAITVRVEEEWLGLARLVRTAARFRSEQQ